MMDRDEWSSYLNNNFFLKDVLIFVKLVCVCNCGVINVYQIY